MSGAGSTATRKRRSVLAVIGEHVTIHRCENCGRWEGEKPQAGCCPGCGRASMPVPYVVEVINHG
jgi:rubrerythrin